MGGGSGQGRRGWGGCRAHLRAMACRDGVCGRRVSSGMAVCSTCACPTHRWSARDPAGTRPAGCLQAAATGASGACRTLAAPWCRRGAGRRPSRLRACVFAVGQHRSLRAAAPAQRLAPRTVLALLLFLDAPVPVSPAVLAGIAGGGGGRAPPPVATIAIRVRPRHWLCCWQCCVCLCGPEVSVSHGALPLAQRLTGQVHRTYGSAARGPGCIFNCCTASQAVQARAAACVALGEAATMPATPPKPGPCWCLPSR